MKRNPYFWLTILAVAILVPSVFYFKSQMDIGNNAAKRNPAPVYPTYSDTEPIPVKLPLTLGDESQLGVKFVSGNVQKIGKELKYSITVESTVIFKSDVAFWIRFYNGKDATGKQVKSIVVRGKTNPKQTITLDGSGYYSGSDEIVSCFAQFVQ